MKKLFLTAALALCGAALFGQREAVPEGFVLVEGGSFQMGSNNGQDNERPVHRVTLKSFYMGKYPVTQKEWREIMGGNPSGFTGNNLPAGNISWYDALEYCNKRSRKEGLSPAYTIIKDRSDPNNRSKDSDDDDSDDVRWLVTWNRNASGYRLPTEAEWEYAAKGGSGSPGNYAYAGGDNVDAVAWYDDNSGGKTHPVGTKAPNTLGLYDMSGNCWEWCWDWYASYESGAQTDPAGASSGSSRVRRGGSWSLSAVYVRSASRYSGQPSYRSYFLGFRVVRPIEN